MLQVSHECRGGGQAASGPCGCGVAVAHAALARGEENLLCLVIGSVAPQSPLNTVEECILELLEVWCAPSGVGCSQSVLNLAGREARGEQEVLDVSVS